MKFKTKKEQIISGLEKVAGIIGMRSTIPILSNVLIEAEDKYVTMVTTDLEMRIKTQIDAVVESPGKTTIPVKKLLTIIKEIRDDELQFESADNSITIKYKNGKSKLFTLSPDDFPVTPEFSASNTFKIVQGDLLRMLRQIDYSVSKDDSRKVLNGIFFSLKQGMFTTVATDGKRLALSEKHVEGGSGDDGDCIITLKTAAELQRLLSKDGDTQIEICGNMIRFVMGNTAMSAKLVEGTYPNYRQVIPTSFSRKFEINNADFLPALRLISLLASETSSYVKINVTENSLVISATSAEVGEGDAKLEISYSGPEMTVSFNPHFLMDPFKGMDADKATFQLNDGYSPVMISAGEGFLYVIMPIRK